MWTLALYSLVLWWWSENSVGQTNGFLVSSLRNSVRWLTTWKLPMARFGSNTLINWNLVKTASKLWVPWMSPKSMPLYLIISSILLLTDCLHLRIHQSPHRLPHNTTLSWHPRIHQPSQTQSRHYPQRQRRPPNRFMVMSEHWTFYLLVGEKMYLSAFCYDLSCGV